MSATSFNTFGGAAGTVTGIPSLAGIDADALFGALSHRHRRAVLSCLLDAGEPLSLYDLTDHVARTDDDGSGDERDWGRLSLRLYHVHLPKLQRSGFVEFDAGSRTYASTPAAQSLESHLDATRSPDSEPDSRLD